MVLPTRGQRDWDDELNNELSRLDGDVQSAKADATSAKSTAISAQNSASAAANSAAQSATAAQVAANGANRPTADAMDAVLADPSSAAAQRLAGTYAARKSVIGDKPFNEPRATPGKNTWFVGFDDVANVVYFADQNGLFRSSDEGVTLSSNLTVPNNAASNPGNHVKMILRAGGFLYCNVRNPTTFISEIWRATPTTGNTALSWTLVHTQTTGSSAAFYGHLATDGTSIVAVDYGDPKEGGVNTARIWRTLVSDGLTWSVVATGGPTQRHWHAVAADPYQPGRYVATLGDAPNPSAYVSEDSGLTWTGIAAVTEKYQSVDISFTPDLCVLASDTMRSDGFMLDRETLTNIQHISTSDHRTFTLPRPGYYPSGGFTTTGSAIFQDYTTLPFKSSDVGRRITGAGIPDNTKILSYQNATQVTLDKNATATASGTVAYTIERPEQVPGAAFFGRIDPDTGIYYFLANFEDGTEVYPMRPVLFYVKPGGRSEPLDTNIVGTLNAVWIRNGRLYYGRYSRPLLSLADTL